MASTRARLRAAARRGARVLDDRLPGWWRSIRTTRLRMARGAVSLTEDGAPREEDWCGCVGVQIALSHKSMWVGDAYVSWWDAMQALGITEPQSTRFGFQLGREDVQGSDDEVLWELLDEAWADEVRARRREARACAG